jgi:tetratricopeptide (TPR) repeat protein
MFRLVLVLAFVAASGTAAFAIRGTKEKPPSASKASPEAIATEALNSGLERLGKGDKAEAEKAQKQARKEYENALRDFKKAVSVVPDMYRAHNGMGYASRKLGDYAGALAHYERALKLAPSFADAIEYRAEAYLGLNRTDEAKQAYLQLFATDRPKADILMKAMQAWVETRKADPAGVAPSAITTFEGWVRERAELAVKTANMAHNAPDWK